MDTEKNSFLDNLKANPRNRIEIVDGIIVVYTGYFYDGYGHDERGKVIPKKIEIIEMYDQNGNELHLNCSKEKAGEIVANLEREGKKAIIGSVAPNGCSGKSQKEKHPDWVGIYIVKDEKTNNKANNLEER